CRRAQARLMRGGRGCGRVCRLYPVLEERGFDDEVCCWRQRNGNADPPSLSATLNHEDLMDTGNAEPENFIPLACTAGPRWSFVGAFPADSRATTVRPSSSNLTAPVTASVELCDIQPQRWTSPATWPRIGAAERREDVRVARGELAHRRHG